MSYITRERRRSYDYSVKIKIGSTIGWGWKCTQGQDQALQTISITSAKKKNCLSYFKLVSTLHGSTGRMLEKRTANIT